MKKEPSILYSSKAKVYNFIRKTEESAERLFGLELKEDFIHINISIIAFKEFGREAVFPLKNS